MKSKSNKMRINAKRERERERCKWDIFGPFPEQFSDNLDNLGHS